MPKPNARSICTAQYASGRFCEERSLPGAPFPICVHHAALVLEFLDNAMPREQDDRVIVAWRAMEQRREYAARRQSRQTNSVVYYLRVDDLVKIGYTDNLAQRLSSYPPNSELLAVETGSPALEQQRHSEFAACRAARKEWFRQEPELLAHIEKVRSEQAA